METYAGSLAEDDLSLYDTNDETPKEIRLQQL